MSSEIQPRSNPVWMTILGWIITLLPAAGLLFSAYAKLIHYKPPDGSPDIGWPADVIMPLAVIEIACTVLYLFPRTAALGAILLTGYLGGAVGAHVRIHDKPFAPLVIGVLVWLGLFFRDPRVRALLPIRSYPFENAGEVGFVGLAKTLAFALVGIILAMVGVAALTVGVAAPQPADYLISRSATMDAPPEKVFAEVNDFHNWAKWSPWLALDPNAKETFEGPASGKGAIFRWAGNNEVGEGSMTILESEPNKLIKIRLEFVKPFADVADTDFYFKTEGDKTNVTWTMSGERDLLGKAMCLLMDMENMVGGKYEEGLANLKRVVEGREKK